MNEIIVKRINNSNISILKGDTILVPVRPICDALGVDFSSQRKKIFEDPILSTVMVEKITAGADGKQREMFCLPLEFVYGWLFTINPDKVKPEVAKQVITYKRECYHALYNYFVQGFRYAQKCNEQEVKLLERISEIKDSMLTTKRELKQAQERLSKMRTERLTYQPSLFDSL